FTGGLDEIEEVHSHSHAIAPCQQYLHQHIAQADIQFTSSTGKAAEVVSSTEKRIAAIGNKLAASEYGPHTYKADSHDYPNNHTRSFVLTKDKDTVQIDHPKETDKTSLRITLPSDYAGALHQVLSAVAWRKMNLSKIESRPMKTGLGNYFFIIDVDEPYDDALFPRVQGELQALDCKVNVLGTYPVYQF